MIESLDIDFLNKGIEYTREDVYNVVISSYIVLTEDLPDKTQVKNFISSIRSKKN